MIKKTKVNGFLLKLNIKRNNKLVKKVEKLE
jgi:hypothetical protein